MEHHRDVELFLEGQARWEVDSPHCLIILHEMFQHASEQEQKEAECMICWGCRHGLLKLDPKADISAVQLVGPQTSGKEFKSLYYEVYKLQRLPGSPPREPELVAEGVSSLEDCLGQKGGRLPWMTKEPNPTGLDHKEQDPQEGRREASMERSLTEAREAHWRALAMAVALEEETVQLSHPITRSRLEAWAHSRSQDCHRWRSRGQKGRCHQVWPEDCHAPYFEYHPSWRGSESEENEEAPKDFNLEELP